MPPRLASVERIGGHDVRTNPVEATRRLAFMPDEPQLFEWLASTA